MGSMFPPPARPPTPPAPPSRAPWHHEHPALATIVALAIVAALLAAVLLLVPRGSSNTSVYEVGPYPGMYASRPGTIINIHNEWEYYNYLNLSVRPSLLSISLSFSGVACSAVQNDPDGVVVNLAGAREAARAALNESRRILPPGTLQPLHAKVQQVFQDTVTTTDSLLDCIQSGGAASGCPQAQEQTGKLMDDVVSLTQEVKTAVGGQVARL